MKRRQPAKEMPGAKRQRQTQVQNGQHVDLEGAETTLSGCIRFPEDDGHNINMDRATPMVECPEPLPSVSMPLSSPERMRYSLRALDSETHATCHAVLAAEQSDKATGDAYRRQYNNYMTWWTQDQARAVSEDAMRKEIPALPITGAKVAAFLLYETTRPKKKQGSKAGDRVGKSQVALAINGLEYYRHQHQHEYQDDQEAQRGLRNDKRVRAFESASKHNEPKRAENSQALKAAGASSDTYTPDELAKCAG
ncbi:hypothetical protein FPV67DRAFT_489719 [Lyophyllum atratum]|nr:hypothetical protein FPV67DRAFT_489719 [Lyophyllum atratum]